MRSRKDKILLFLNQIVSDKEINSTEKAVFETYLKQLSNNKDINRCIYELKSKLSNLSMTNQLSSKGLAYFTELSRIEPSTSVSSMWNFLVRKK
jgi:hypothetical protein